MRPPYKENKIYVFVMDWPSEGPLVLPPISRKITSMTARTGEKATLEQTKDKIALSVTWEHRDPMATVIELTLDGPAAEIAPKDVIGTAGGKSLAAGKPVKASNVYGNTVDAHGPQKLVDGDHSTRWAAHESDQPVWIEIDLGKPTKIGKVHIDERDWNRVKRFTLQVSTDGGWRNVLNGTTIGADFSANFEPVSTSKIRLQILEASAGATIWEIELFP